MGQRTTQRILTCALCGDTPDDGEYMWEMCGEYWCATCCKKDENEVPELLTGTKDALNDLAV